MVIRWVTRSLWPQQDGCPRHAMLRVIPSQCLGIMPGFHVPDGLDNVKIKIQERLPVRYPLPTGYIGGPWIFDPCGCWSQWCPIGACESSSTPPGCSCKSESSTCLRGANFNRWWPYQSGIGRESHGGPYVHGLSFVFHLDLSVKYN